MAADSEKPSDASHEWRRPNVTETFRDNGIIMGGMGRPYGNRRLTKPISGMWHDRGKGSRKRAPLCAHIVHVTHPYAAAKRCQGSEHGREHADRSEGTADGFHHLVEPAERVQTAHKRKSRSNGAEKTPREARFRQHPLADTVPPRTPAQRRQLAGAMELLKDAGDGADDGADCHVEVLTLGDEVLWDYERYEIAVELGLEVRPIPFRGSDPAVRLCIETLHAPEFNGGLRALIAVVSCEWAARGRPLKLTLGVSFRGTPWTIQEMATLGRVGTTRISEAKQLCAFSLENLVLTRELAFGEALKRIQLVRASRPGRIRSGGRVGRSMRRMSGHG